MATKEGKNIIMSGWKSVGIPQAIRTNFVNLESLDLFCDIDPLISEVTHENNINMAKTNEEEREVLLTLRLIFMKTKAIVMKIFKHRKMIIVTFSIFLKTLNIRCHEKYL